MCSRLFIIIMLVFSVGCNNQKGLSDQESQILSKMVSNSSMQKADIIYRNWDRRDGFIWRINGKINNNIKQKFKLLDEESSVAVLVMEDKSLLVVFIHPRKQEFIIGATYFETLIYGEADHFLRQWAQLTGSDYEWLAGYLSDRSNLEEFEVIIPPPSSLSQSNPFDTTQTTD